MSPCRIKVQHEFGEYRQVIIFVISYAQRQPDREFLDIRIIIDAENFLPYRDRKVRVGKMIGSLQKPLQQNGKGCFSGIVFTDKKRCPFAHVEAAILQKPKILNFDLFNMHVGNTPDCAARFLSSVCYFMRLSCCLSARKV